jgi:acyl CoA:acetate/3-ketoacid CoA transferase
MEHVRENHLLRQDGPQRGQNVYYVTQRRACIKLTEQGMMLVEVMPGIDVKRDILEVSPMKIVLPAGEIPVVPRRSSPAVNFKLKWEHGSA